MLELDETSKQAGSLERVLLVDDNPVNLQILYKTLQGSGYKLLIAKDGEEALDIASKVKPSVILLDIMMPGMDGYEVCRTLKQNPLTVNIAVIFLSALEDSKAKVKGFAVGGVDYIAKPFQADEVVARVRNHIKIHRLEQQLARRNIELESENQQILDAVGEGIIGLDKNGLISFINPSASRITGWSAVDSIGEQISTLGLLGGGQLAEHDLLPYRSYRMGQTVSSDMEYLHCRDKTIIPVAITSTPRAGGGAVVALRDIGEWVDSEEKLRLAREELESQRQNIAHIERLNTTGAMAAGIAHEVNQPLTAVSNYSTVAQRMMQGDKFDQEKLIEILEKINRQALRASDVIQRMRSYVKKPESGRREISINKLLREVIALAEVDSRINDVGIDLVPDIILPKVTVDAVEIQQVALNLIRNAMESMAGIANSQQGVVVKTGLQGDYVCVEVIDAGSGVSEEAQKGIFSPFFSTKKSGMGIGLSVCQAIIQANGGQIGFRPNPEVGSTFYFTLPTTV